MVRENLITIEENDRLEAGAAVNSLNNAPVRNRAYVNSLGSELALKYLASLNIDVRDLPNIHSIKRILGEFDISDIILPNIHIDVRVVYDENVIFIPKSHFEYNLVPDIYLVLKLAEDNSSAEFLGFFEPKLINKNNANKNYYFIEKEKLSAPSDLKNYIENSKKNTGGAISDDELSTCENLIVSISDGRIPRNEKKYLISQLLKSPDLREKFIEYENFELLSHKAMEDGSINLKEYNEENSDAKKATFAENLIDNLAQDESVQIENMDHTEGFDELPQIDMLSETASLGAVEASAEIIEDSVADAEPIAEALSGENSELSEGLTEEPAEPLDTVLEELPEAEGLSEESVEPLDTVLEELPEAEGLAEEPAEPLDTVLEELPEAEGLMEGSVEPLDTVLEELPEAEGLTEGSVEPLDTVLEELPEAETIAEEPAEPLDTVLEELPEAEGLNEESAEPLDTVLEELPEAETLAEESVEPLDTELEELPEAEALAEEPAEPLDTVLEELPEAEGLSEEPVEPIDTALEELPEAETLTEEHTEPIDTAEDEVPETIESAAQDSIPETVDENLPDSIDNVLDELSDITETLPESDMHENTTSQSFEDFDLDTIAEHSVADISTDEASLKAEIEAKIAGGDVNESGIEGFKDDTETNELGLLYDDEKSSPADINELPQDVTFPGAAFIRNYKSVFDKIDKRIVAVTAAVLILAVGAISAVKHKPSDIEPAEPVKDAVNTSDNALEANIPQVDNNTAEVKKVETRELKSTAKQVSSNSYMSVSKIVWDVPDTLSYSSKMQNFLRMAGKSIKLSLSADLLLTSEYAYTNQVKIGLKLTKDGNINEAKILSGSGSNEIDNIVLQSVKSTLNVLKPPANEINTSTFDLNIIIYF